MYTLDKQVFNKLDTGWLAPNGDWYPCDYMEHMALADVVQVIHSRWIKTEDGAECEKCGREAVYQIVDDHWEYEPWCPHCGSIMDAEE